MKELIIGIDGGDQRILEAFDMPFVHSLLKNGYCQKLELDLFSRGWAEMMTGKHGKDTRAYYMHPKLDGTREFTTSFSMTHLEALKDTPSIWEVANEAGYSVGFMNVPTSAPSAKEIEGFLVGSGGGGLDKIEGVPESLCSSHDVKQFLDENGYIVDLRFTSSGIEEFKELFDKLTEMDDRRADIYIKMCKKYGTDVGFFSTRGLTTIQYLFMSEIEAFIASKEMGDELHLKFLKNNELQRLIVKLFRSADDYIKRLFDELNPEHVILTADHGCVPFKYRGCVKPFLKQQGFYVEKEEGRTSMRRSLSKLYGKLFGQASKKSLVKKLPRNVVSKVSKVDWAKTVAFGNRYVTGIYLNDERFGGPVTKNKEKIIREICEAFNSTPEASDFNMTAFPYRSEYADAQFVDGLPDIKIDAPDHIFFDSDGPSLVRPNPNYGPVQSLQDVKEDMFTGHKSRYPLFCVDKETAKLIRADDPNDLRLVYKLTERIVAA